MPSRLSSLLVRDGLVGVKRMEKAFQRQVIYGGSLDTILLEMNLIPEERLTQYLALASGLPPAARDEAKTIQADATALVERELAEQFRAIPVAIAGPAVRVIVCAPLELTELEDLADLLDRPLQPLIAPEYRWHLVLAAAYGLEPPARFTTLARHLEADATLTPVGRARSVIVESSPPANRTQSPVGPLAPPIPLQVVAPPPRDPLAPLAVDDRTMKMVATLEVMPDDGRQRTNTLIGINPNRAATEMGSGIPEARPPAALATPSTGIPRQIVDEPSTGPKRSRKSSAKIAKRGASAPIATEGRDSPLAFVRAREILATADDRDTVFITLLRAARSRSRWAGLLTVQGGAAIGRVALAEAGIDVSSINRVLIPLDGVSPFRNVVNNQQPHIGALVSGDPSIDSMVLRMGGTMPPSGLIMPIVLRDRVVALVVAHRVHSDLRIADVTELLPLGSASADALGRLIVKHKSAGYRTAGEVPIVEIEAEMVDTKPVRRAEAEWSAPDHVEQPPLLPFDDEPEVEITTMPARSIEDVISDIDAAKEGDADADIAEAVERAGEALRVLVRKFPGKLRVDRFAVTGRPLRAMQYGGMLELVVRLGGAASDLLIEKMAAPQRDIRFYATVCAAELRPRNAVFALVERVFDQDFGVRASAIEALAGYPVQELGQALARARRAVHSTDPEVVAAATSALVALGDVEAIPDLMGGVERSDRGGEHTRKALIALTAQDFGPSERKWQKWYEGARRRHRIEWLIEGLSHKEDAIREGAINDLRRLTGEYFGYHHDLARREREIAAERWGRWWRESGQRRFEHREDERHRPTAVLPSRNHE